jgi:hypothetical protein
MARVLRCLSGTFLGFSSLLYKRRTRPWQPIRVTCSALAANMRDMPRWGMLPATKSVQLRTIAAYIKPVDSSF